MSRSERYIAPSADEVRCLEKAIQAKKRFDQDREELLRTALARLRKADLVELTLRIAHEEQASEWRLEQELDLDKPPGLLVNDIETAIDAATKVDEQRLNTNFGYDWRAYDAVLRGLLQLIQKNAMEDAKRLALKLMDKGSFQIECSDEGLMQEDIENCLRPIISAVAKWPDGGDWAREMLCHDRMRFLCEQELTELAGTIPGAQ